MADSDQILQLGIEEARNGNREAARNLFELLTRQEPKNTQAWLWLAGVAEGPDQRREALQQVITLDPENEMARKGLQAMGVAVPAAGVAPTVIPEPPVFSRPVGELEPTVIPEPVQPIEPIRPAEPVRERSADEAFADELDLAFDDSYASIPRAEAPVRNPDDADTITGMAADRSERPTARRPKISVRPRDDQQVALDEDDYEPESGGPKPWLWAILALLGLLILGWLFMFLTQRPSTPPTPRPTAIASNTRTVATAVPAGEATAVPAGEATAVPAGEATAVPAGEATAVPAGEATAVPAGEATAVPAGEATAVPVVLPDQINAVPVGTTLEASGWSYSYPNAAYVAVLGPQAGGQTAKGTFVHVLVWVANNTGSDQPMPADFFALRDAQGRVFTADAKLSSALVQRGVNADLGLEDAVPANGVTTSIYLVFNVEPGASDLTLFTKPNPSQGFKLNVSVP